jgi:tetratricopeptide (TPR) repeat protein
MNRLASVSVFVGTRIFSADRGSVTPADPPTDGSASAEAGVQEREKLDSRSHGNDARGALLAALFLIVAALSACKSELLQKQSDQLKQQQEEIVRQRQEINSLLAAQKVQQQQRRDCNRAFREFFDQAQVSSERDKAIALYREGLALCPDDDVAHYELGKILAETGRYQDAEKEFEIALKINPGFIDAKKQLESVRKGK